MLHRRATVYSDGLNQNCHDHSHRKHISGQQVAVRKSDVVLYELDRFKSKGISLQTYRKWLFYSPNLITACNSACATVHFFGSMSHPNL